MNRNVQKMRFTVFGPVWGGTELFWVVWCVSTDREF